MFYCLLPYNSRLENCIRDDIAPVVQSVWAAGIHEGSLTSKEELIPDTQELFQLYTSYYRGQRTLGQVYFDGVVAARAFAQEMRPKEPMDSNGRRLSQLLLEAGKVLPL